MKCAVEVGSGGCDVRTKFDEDRLRHYGYYRSNLRVCNVGTIERRDK
jgi:hypothetical protein